MKGSLEKTYDEEKMGVFEGAENIRFFEELSLNAHPSFQTKHYDGWLLGFANGYTNRANSVNMIYPSTIDLQTKIKVCEEYYCQQQLPCVFKMTVVRGYWMRCYKKTDTQL